jgi:hypothetical protein
MFDIRCAVHPGHFGTTWDDDYFGSRHDIFLPSLSDNYSLTVAQQIVLLDGSIVIAKRIKGL